MAYKYAWHLSQDPVTKTGAVIVHEEYGDVIVYGVNHFPEGIEIPENLASDENRPWRLEHIIHSEPAAIFKAAKKGVRTQGTTMYMPWIPCTPCAVAIIDAGIAKLIGHKSMIMKTPKHWWETCDHAIDVLKKGGVEFLMYDGPIGECKGFMRNYGEWNP